MRTLLLPLLLAGAAAEPAIPPESEALRQRALVHLFNLDFAESRADLRIIIDREPESPFGHLFEAGALWWQASTEFDLFKDTPTLEGLFEEDAALGLRKAEPWIESEDPARRAHGYFAAGMILGLRGQWQLSRGKWIKAYRDGKRAVKYLKRCVDIDPEYHDAYLGLGIFDYQTDRLPGILKVPALLMIRGDAERGKARMRQAAERGNLVTRQAAIFLLSLTLTDDKDYARALPMLQPLRRDYPDSPYYRFLEALILHKLGDWEESRARALDLFRAAERDPEILGRKQLGTLCGLYGAACFEKDKLEEAAAWLTRAIEAPLRGQPAGWASLCRLYRGLAYDMLGRREEALADYEKVSGPSRALAERCRAAPCGRDAVEAELKRLALSD